MIASKDYNFYNFRSELIKELIVMENEVYLVCPYGEKIEIMKDWGCEFIDLKIDRRGMNPIKDLEQILYYKKIFKLYNPDIVLLYTGKCSIYGGIACKKNIHI